MFSPAVHDVRVSVHAHPVSLLKNDFSLVPHNYRADGHRGSGSGGGAGKLIMNFSAALAERIQLKF